MDQRLAEAVGDLMLLLHTRTRSEPAPLLDAAIVRFARHFAAIGVSRRAMLDVLQGLIDQAVASSDLTSDTIVGIADELQSRVPALCARAYDSAHPVVADPGSMKLSVGIDAGIATLRVAGRYPPAGVMAAIEAVLAATGHAPINGTLIDLRDSQSIESRARAEMESTGALLASLRNQFGGRVAVVVRSDIAYSQVRVAAIWAGANGLVVHVDRNERRALAWLRQ